MDWEDPLNESDLVLCLLLPEAQDFWKSSVICVRATLQGSRRACGRRQSVAFMSVAVDRTRLVESVVVYFFNLIINYLLI